MQGKPHYRTTAQKTPRRVVSAPIQIAFYRAHAGNGTIFDHVIAWGTLGPYSHVELIYPDGMSWSSSARDGGVRWRNIDYSTGRWDIYDLSILGLNERAMRRYCYRQHGKQYDYLGVCPPPGIQTPGRIFCSEGCHSALVAGGLKSRWPSSFVSPNRLYRIIQRALNNAR